MGSNFKMRMWLEILTSRDAKSASFKRLKPSCDVAVSGSFLGILWPKKMMDASCWRQGNTVTNQPN